MNSREDAAFSRHQNANEKERSSQREASKLQ
jgi:hypothetical protein